MKKYLIIAMTGWLLSFSYTADAALVNNSSYENQSKSDRKEERAYRKERRKAKRAEWRIKNGKADHIMRENNKQRRKMERASRKENRRRWDTNELGDVYGIR